MNKKFFKEMIMITLGVALAAAGLKLFLVPNQIAAGGISGVAVILFYLFKFPVGITYIVLNIPLFLLGIRYVGKLFALKALYATILYSVLADLINFEVVKGDMFLASVFGGVLVGIGLGIVVKNDATTGGTVMVAKILNHWFRHISVSILLFVVDFIVIFASGIVFSPVSALYAIASIYISTKIMEVLLEGLQKAKAFFIISNKTEEIGNVILYKIDRGATLLYGKGMYTGEPRNVIMCIVERPSEVEAIKREAKLLDKNAFIIAADIKEVLGEGFPRD